MRVDWLPESVTSVWLGVPGRLGMCRCPGSYPGRGQRPDDALSEDLDALVSAGTNVLVTLVTAAELEEAGLPSFFPAVEARGLRAHHWPFEDGSVPAEPPDSILARVVRHLELSDSVVVHCMAGRSRTGLFVSLVLLRLGMRADDAIEIVRRCRHPGCMDDEQEAFVRAWHPATK